MSTIARRYAQALYAQAADDAAVDRVDDDVALVRETVEASRELAGVLASPVVTSRQKTRIVEALFGAKVSPTAMTFVRFLIEHGREALLPDVARAYVALRDEQQGTVEAHVRAALPLPEGERQQLKKALEARTGKKVRLDVREDASLIGGLVIRIGDTVYDGSVRNQLAELRERMDTPAVSLN